MAHSDCSTSESPRRDTLDVDQQSHQEGLSSGKTRPRLRTTIEFEGKNSLSTNFLMKDGGNNSTFEAKMNTTKLSRNINTKTQQIKRPTTKPTSRTTPKSWSSDSCRGCKTLYNSFPFCFHLFVQRQNYCIILFYLMSLSLFYQANFVLYLLYYFVKLYVTFTFLSR